MDTPRLDIAIQVIETTIGFLSADRKKKHTSTCTSQTLGLHSGYGSYFEYAHRVLSGDMLIIRQLHVQRNNFHTKFHSRERVILSDLLCMYRYMYARVSGCEINRLTRANGTKQLLGLTITFQVPKMPPCLGQGHTTAAIQSTPNESGFIQVPLRGYYTDR